VQDGPLRIAQLVILLAERRHRLIVKEVIGKRNAAAKGLGHPHNVGALGLAQRGKDGFLGGVGLVWWKVGQ